MGTTIKKNAQGYGYRYTDISEIHEWLEQNNLCYYQYVEAIDGNDYIMTVPIINGDVQEPRRGCRIIGASLNGKSNPAQEQGAAITYARRYSLLMAFGLATVDDDAESLTQSKTSVENQKINQAKVNSIETKCKEDNVDISVVLNKCNVKSLYDLTEKQYFWLTHYWTKEILMNGNKGKD